MCKKKIILKTNFKGELILMNKKSIILINDSI